MQLKSYLVLLSTIMCCVLLLLAISAIVLSPYTTPLSLSPSHKREGEWKQNFAILWLSTEEVEEEGTLWMKEKH